MASCSAASRPTSVTASRSVSLSRRSAVNSCSTRSASIASFLAAASALSFSACSAARCLASSRCCSFFASSASCLADFCFSAFLAFSSSFFSCCFFAARSISCCFFFSMSRLFFSSAFSASRITRSASCLTLSSSAFFAFSLRTSSAFFSAAFRLFNSSGSTTSSADWLPLEVLCWSSSSALTLVTAFIPMDSMASWNRAAAASAAPGFVFPDFSFCDSAFSTSSPSFRSLASSNCRHTSLSWSRSTNWATAAWKPRRRWRHFFTSPLTSSRAAFSVARFSASSFSLASSASRTFALASSFALWTDVRSISRFAISAWRSCFFASFSAAMRGSYFSAWRTSSEMRSRSACLYFRATRSFSFIIQRFSSRHSASSRSCSSSPSFCARTIGSRQEEKVYQNS
mmetsp:Transcript_16470/g.43514  ORF Transcript_16470/g.43514 Transcript_16470/m.43514 type:complete len:400 (-) Transcript_16470:814-2013(-)